MWLSNLFFLRSFFCIISCSCGALNDFILLFSSQKSRKWIFIWIFFGYGSYRFLFYYFIKKIIYWYFYTRMEGKEKSSEDVNTENYVCNTIKGMGIAAAVLKSEMNHFFHFRGSYMFITWINMIYIHLQTFLLLHIDFFLHSTFLSYFFDECNKWIGIFFCLWFSASV